ncbi:MAG: hypothetical protein HY791_36300 [Deltaproteobacteria bacterium]|nr:hypothetical protein [Deltaproteobacteria bacterium]
MNYMFDDSTGPVKDPSEGPPGSPLNIVNCRSADNDVVLTTSQGEVIIQAPSRDQTLDERLAHLGTLVADAGDINEVKVPDDFVRPVDSCALPSSMDEASKEDTSLITTGNGPPGSVLPAGGLVDESELSTEVGDPPVVESTDSLPRYGEAALILGGETCRCGALEPSVVVWGPGRSIVGCQACLPGLQLRPPPVVRRERGLVGAVEVTEEWTGHRAERRNG